jgi:hypothetical protein
VLYAFILLNWPAVLLLPPTHSGSLFEDPGGGLFEIGKLASIWGKEFNGRELIDPR